MKAQFLKMAGVKSEKEFYKKYPDEESFFSAHPQAAEMAMGGQDPNEHAGIYPGFLPQQGFQTPFEMPQMNFGNPDDINHFNPVTAPPMEWGNPDDLNFFDPNVGIPPQAQPNQDVSIPNNTPSSGKFNIKDYLKAGTDRLQKNSDKFMAAYNNPVSAISMLGYAGNIAEKFANNKKQRGMDDYYRNQFNSDNYFPTVPTTSGDRGDYVNTGSAYGMFRPDQMGAKLYTKAYGGEGPDDPVKPVKPGKPGPIKPRPYQPDITLPNWDGLVQKDDGSIGMWGKDIPQFTAVPPVPLPPPEAYTDHNMRRSGSYYQGQPTADQKIQAIRQRLLQEAAANPIKHYKQGGQYSVTPEELSYLLASGADIEFI